MALIEQAIASGRDPSTWLIGSGTVAVMTLLISGIVRMQRLTNKTTEAWDKPYQLLEEALQQRNVELNSLNDRVDKLERHVRECEYTNDLLIRTLQENALTVPPAVFLRRRRMGDVDDE